MTRALLVDPNFSSVPIRHALERLGIDVATVGKGLTDSGSKRGMHFDCDYGDVPAMQNLLRREKFDYLVPGCTDKSYETCCRLAPDFDFAGLDSDEVVKTLHSKRSFRALCSSLSIPTPRVFSCHGDALDSAVPLIVKPDDSFSGRGITKLESPTQNTLSQAVMTAETASPTGVSVVEEYVYGELFSFSAFVTNMGVKVAFSVAEYGTENPYAVDTSYVVRDHPLAHLLLKHAEKIVHALKLNVGLLHLQYISSGSQYWLIEATRRCPGDLYSEMIRHSTGYPYAEAFASAFIGQAPSDIKTQMPQRHLVRHTVSEKAFNLLGERVFSEGRGLEAWFPVTAKGAVVSGALDARAGIALLSAADETDIQKILQAIVSGGSAFNEVMRGSHRIADS